MANALATHITRVAVDYLAEAVVFANGSLPAYMQAGATVHTQILIEDDLEANFARFRI